MRSTSFGMVALMAVLAGPMFTTDASSRGCATLRTEEGTMTQAIASGTFEVELTPQPSDSEFGKFSLDKRFEGGLVGISRGEMLSWGNPSEGPAAYVAVEHVDGAVDGRSGSFVLAHRGTMTADGQQLTIVVVPGSATGELEGLSGTMDITIVDGTHEYELRYELP